jgi:hypothetical protein
MTKIVSTTPSTLTDVSFITYGRGTLNDEYYIDWSAMTVAPTLITQVGEYTLTMTQCL